MSRRDVTLAIDAMSLLRDHDVMSLDKPFQTHLLTSIVIDKVENSMPNESGRSDEQVKADQRRVVRETAAEYLRARAYALETKAEQMREAAEKIWPSEPTEFQKDLAK